MSDDPKDYPIAEIKGVPVNISVTCISHGSAHMKVDWTEEDERRRESLEQLDPSRIIHLGAPFNVPKDPEQETWRNRPAML